MIRERAGLVILTQWIMVGWSEVGCTCDDVHDLCLIFGTARWP